MRGIPNRHWLRFGTRTLLCVVAVVAVFTVVVGKRIREYESRRRHRIQRQQELAQDLPQLIPLLIRKRNGTLVGTGDIRVPAAQWVAEIGPPARSALPALRTLAKDKDPWIAKQATDAIASIEKPERSLMSRLLTWDWDD